MTRLRHTGTFGNPNWLPCVVAFPSGTDSGGSIVAIDLNQDGFTDLVVNLGRPTGGIATYLGRGDGTFSAPLLTERFGSMSVADFNLDGKPDLFVHNALSLGNGDGTFSAPLNTGVIGGLTAAADFTGDCIPDVVFTDHGGGAAVLVGRGDGTFAPQPHFVMVGYPRAIAAGDLGCTGRADLVTIGGLGGRGLEVLSSTCH